MQPFHSTLVDNRRFLPGIHGLRGIAALAVLLAHLALLTKISPPDAFDFIARDFRFAVHLFFIISAFSLMHSTEPKLQHENWVKAFFMKRFCRIAPLYYFMLLLFFMLNLAGNPTLSQMILNLTFTFGFVPSSHIVWASWSIGVEMIFYVIFPVLICVIRTERSALILLVLSVIICAALRTVLHHEYQSMVPQAPYDWSYNAIPSNICYFAMGIYAYFLTRSHAPSSLLMHQYMPIVAVTLIFGMMLSGLGSHIYHPARFDIVIWGIGLTALCAWQASNPSVMIANPFLEYLGERSYSIYLWHPVVIHVAKSYLESLYTLLSPLIGSYAFFPVSLVVIVGVLCVAELTYRMIEVPGIKLGQQWMRKGAQ